MGLGHSMVKTKDFLLKSLFTLFIVFTVGLAMTPVAHAKSAGTVTFTTGDTSIVRADKSVVKAAKNDAVNAGDTIETKNGRLQLSLIDGGKVSLQPNTIYKINKYEFSGKEDGSEYAFTELLKGGMRTISGLIGHKNRERYQLKTAVATIGIRGTEFTVNFNDNQLLMTTNQGSVDVCNASGCLNALSGQSIAVNGVGAKPKLSAKAAKAAAAPPASNKTVFTALDAVTETGLPQLIANIAEGEGLVTPSALDNYNGKAYVGTIMKTDSCGGCGIDDTYAADLLTDSNAQLTNVSNISSDSANVSNSPSYKYDQYSDGLISIGRVWDSGSGYVGNVSNAGVTGSIKWLDYMVGVTPAPGQLNNLTGTYNVFASTAPMMVDANNISSQVGSANTATGNLAFNFGTGIYNYNLTVNTIVDAFQLTGNGGSLNKNDPRFATGGTITSTGTTCQSVTCNPAINGVNLVQGAFFGKNGERAGMQYGFYVGGDSIWGTTALKK